MTLLAKSCKKSPNLVTLLSLQYCDAIYLGTNILDEYYNDDDDVAADTLKVLSIELTF